MTHLITQALILIIETLFSLYISIVLLRFLFQSLRVDFYNPISQSIMRLTDPLLVPLRKYIPGYAGIDVASIVLLIALQMIAQILIILLKVHVIPGIMGILVLSISTLLSYTINIFFYAILIQAILSWVQPRGNPYSVILNQICEPIMKPARRLIPPMGGIDVSPIIALLGLQLIRMLIVAPIGAIGFSLAIS